MSKKYVIVSQDQYYTEAGTFSKLFVEARKFDSREKATSVAQLMRTPWQILEYPVRVPTSGTVFAALDIYIVTRIKDQRLLVDGSDAEAVQSLERVQKAAESFAKTLDEYIEAKIEERLNKLTLDD